MILVCLLLAAAALPASEYSTYIGDENTWRLSQLLADASGNTYVAGSRTFNLSFDPMKPMMVSEAIVAKLDAAGKTTLFAGIGGKGNDAANGVALDRAGNIYLAGRTGSPNFPVRNALYPAPVRPSAGFLTKYTPAGEVVYSTYFPEAIEYVAVDAAGAVYVSGMTLSRDFPVTTGLPKGPVGSGVPMIYGAYLTKISPAGDRIVYSMVISGQQKNCGAGSSCFLSSRGARSVGLALDAAGNAYMAGNADVTDLPTTPGVLTPTGAGAFVAKVNAAGTGLAYLTYLGVGAQTFAPFFGPATIAGALAVDAAGNAYIAGGTWDPHLPVTAGAYQTKFRGWSEIENAAYAPPPDAFAVEVNPTGTAVVWGSYLGGDAADSATAATLDAAGNLWVSGTTNSAEFPNVDGWSSGEDFIVKFNATGGLPYSARYPAGTVSQTLAVDAAGMLHTATPNGVVSVAPPGANPLIRPWVIGPDEGHISAGEVISIYGPHIGTPGVRVFINDVPAPLLYAGDQQINAVVPFEIAGQKTARIRVGAGPGYDVAVLTAVPQIFGALNQDGSVNSPGNPAPVGSVMSIWVAGAVPPFPAVPTGSIATGADPYFVGRLFADSEAVKTLYSGAAPGLVAGIAQINLVTPNSSSLVLATDRYASPPFYIYVTPTPDSASRGTIDQSTPGGFRTHV